MIHAVTILGTTAVTALGSAMFWLASPSPAPQVSMQASSIDSQVGSQAEAAQLQRAKAQDEQEWAEAAHADDAAPDQRLRAGHRHRPHGQAHAGERHVEALSPLQIEQAIDILCQLDRERCEKLQDRRCEDPSEFDEQFARYGWRLLALSRLQQSNPGLFNLKVQELRLDSQINTTAELYRQASAKGGREAAALEMQLTDLLRSQMELRLQVRGQQLLVLEQHVVAARDQLAEDARAFANEGEEMISRRLSALKQRPAESSGTDGVEPVDGDVESDASESPDSEAQPVFAAPQR